MNMRFITDQQTLEDLQIFGRHGGGAAYGGGSGGSVYALFNRTCTRGGAQILEELFRYPLADEQAINRRSGVIRELAHGRAVFPFSSELFDVAEQYLADTDERTKLATEDRTLGERLSGVIGADNTFKAIHKGVAAVMEIIGVAKEFADSGLGAGVGSADGFGELERVMQTLMGGELGKMLGQAGGQKLSYARVAELDVLIRFRQRKLILELLRQIYYLDVYLAVGKVAMERGYYFAKALPAGDHSVTLEGVYHPLLTNAVANTLRITPEGNVLFLTGANMAGKSTFMKSLGIAVFLAHMGFPVPAAAMEFAVLDGMYTTINLPDNLGMGASHFYAEVLRLKKVAQELGRSGRLFIMFDELFRGTNVKDAYEATIAITAAFATRKESIFVISTHIVEAGEVLREQRDNIRFVFLPTRMRGLLPEYTYTIETGITDDRHGMVIINNEDIPGILRRGSAIKR